jgi:SAM-dependent methyltransferase
MPTPVTLSTFLSHVPAGGRVLDVGCAEGGILHRMQTLRPDLMLAGVDISEGDLALARHVLPAADLRHAYGHALPFPDAHFDAITCFEVIEHVPPEARSDVFAEARRVVKPGSRLILSTPHDGALPWLDAQNMRYRFPQLYRLVASGSKRDREYAGQQEVVWHHHFTKGELEGLLRDRWQLLEVSYPSLVLAPLADLLSFPFHRTGRTDNAVFRGLAAVAAWEASWDFGPRFGAGIRVMARAT